MKKLIYPLTIVIFVLCSMSSMIIENCKAQFVKYFGTQGNYSIYSETENYRKLSINPSIEFTYIPPYGSNSFLSGRVHNVNPVNYKIAVYILVEGYGWVIKPTTLSPLTIIQNDSTFSCNIVTGGVDSYATCISAFLLPNGVTPPLLTGSPEIPESMFTDYVNLYTLRYRRSINFASHNWWVKNTVLIAGPGPNYFSDSTQNVWVDNGQLHMKITRRGNTWYCPEVICKDTFAYGKYVFKIASPAGNMDPNIVCGLFTWDMSSIESHREIDIEFSKWGIVQNINAQYVIQPFGSPGHLHHWILPPSIVYSSHFFEWQQDTVKFKSVSGLNINPPDTIYQSWNFTGNSVPHHSKENVRMNLWLFNGIPPSNMQEAEVIIYDFSFSEFPIGITKISSEVPDGYLLYQNYPNPFNPVTTLEFGISNLLASRSGGFVSLKIYDILGKEIAALVNERLSPGKYKVEFDGSGLASGVYFYRLQTNNFNETKMMTLIK